MLDSIFSFASKEASMTVLVHESTRCLFLTPESSSWGREFPLIRSPPICEKWGSSPEHFHLLCRLQASSAHYSNFVEFWHHFNPSDEISHMFLPLLCVTDSCILLEKQVQGTEITRGFLQIWLHQLPFKHLKISLHRKRGENNEGLVGGERPRNILTPLLLMFA